MPDPYIPAEDRLDVIGRLSDRLEDDPPGTLREQAIARAEKPQIPEPDKFKAPDEKDGKEEKEWEKGDKEAKEELDKLEADKPEVDKLDADKFETDKLEEEELGDDRDLRKDGVQREDDPDYPAKDRLAGLPSGSRPVM